MNKKNTRLNVRALLLTGFAVLCCMPGLKGQSFVNDVFLYEVLSEQDKTVNLTGLADMTLTEYEIPSTVVYNGNTYHVSGIGTIFQKRTGITAISLPEGIKNIKEAFIGCTGLQSIVVPGSVTQMDWAFSGCTGLRSVTLTSGIQVIGRGTFSYCSNLTTVEIPATVTRIGVAAFLDCSQLVSIDLPSSIVRIDGGYSSIGYPSGGAFQGCSSLTSIELPQGITTIGEALFKGCSSLETLVIPSRVSIIEKAAFANCTALTQMDIPEGVSELRETFSGCSNLTDISLPSSLTSIGQSTFSGCSKLAQLQLPANVKTIGQNAFENCAALTTLAIPAKVSDLTYVFANCTGLQTIDIPTHITNLYCAFEGCTGLTSVVVPNSVSTMDYAFKGCSNLVSVQLPKSVLKLKGTFADCTSLKEITIPASVENIEGAFAGCTQLTKVVIPNSVKVIGAQRVDGGAFERCTSLKSIELPGSVITMDHAFKGCTSLETVNIPEKVTDLIATFQNCTGLQSMTIPDHVGFLWKAFNGCTGLTSIVVPEGIEDTEASFVDCTNLKSVTLPSSIKDVGYDFKNCIHLQEIHIKAVTPPGYNDNTFTGVDKQTCLVYVPKGALDPYKEWAGFRYILEEGSVVQIQYNITSELRYITASIPEKIDKGMPLTFVMSARSGYVLPEGITIQMGDKKLDPSTDYTYDSATGEVTIPVISGDVHISATANTKQPSMVRVTYELQNITTVAAEEIMNNEQFTFVLTPAAGYDLPEKITIAIGNKTLVENEDYLYNRETGWTTVPASSISGDIRINAAGVKKTGSAYCHIVCQMENMISQAPDSIATGQGLSFVLQAAEGYNLPTSITITMGNRTLVSPADYTYNSTTGQVEIGIVSDNILLVAKAVEKTDPAYCRIVCQVENMISQAPDSIAMGQSLSFVLQAAEGYNLPTSITITMGNRTLVSPTDYTYDSTVGQVKIGLVSDNILLVAQAVKENPVPDDQPLLPSGPDQSFTIHSPASCTDESGHTRPFNGTIGEDSQQTILKQLTVGTEQPATIPLIFRQVAIGDGENGTLATIVTPSTTANILLQGTNSLGIFENNGTTLLTAQAYASLQDTKIINNGNFTDQAALVTRVEGEAALDITAPEDQQILAGETVQLQASTLVDAAYMLTFVWEAEQTDGSWKRIGTARTYASSRSGLRGTKSVVNDRLEIVPIATTRYRCIIKNEVGNVVTMLTSTPATVTIWSSVANETIKKEMCFVVQNGILSVQADEPMDLLIIRFDGQVVRRLQVVAGKTQVDGLARGNYIIWYKNKAVKIHL